MDIISIININDVILRISLEGQGCLLVKVFPVNKEDGLVYAWYKGKILCDCI